MYIDVVPRLDSKKSRFLHQLYCVCCLFSVIFTTGNQSAVDNFVDIGSTLLYINKNMSRPKVRGVVNRIFSYKKKRSSKTNVFKICLVICVWMEWDTKDVKLVFTKDFQQERINGGKTVSWTLADNISQLRDGPAVLQLDTGYAFHKENIISRWADLTAILVLLWQKYCMVGFYLSKKKKWIIYDLYENKWDKESCVFLLFLQSTLNRSPIRCVLILRPAVIFMSNVVS